MTRHEKISSALSIIAVVISILSPIFSYYYLDPTTKAFKERGRLQCYFEREANFPNPSYQIVITNIGQREAKDIQVVIKGTEKINGMQVTFRPPLEFTEETKGDMKYIIIKRALAPGIELNAFFSQKPKIVWVSNEFGETSELVSFNGPGDSHQN